MITVLTLLKVRPSPNGEQHGERPFWREFGERYLDAWIANVERYVPEPYEICVMSDVPLTHFSIDRPVALDATVDAPGFWAKLNMFRPEVSQGKCLYLDLDNVLCGDISELCALTPDPLVMLDDRRVPRLPNGSAILFDADRCRMLWESYREQPRKFEASYVARGDDYSEAYDQAYIARCVSAYKGAPVPFFQDLLPRDYCLNAVSELPHAEDWRASRLIFGGGMSKEGKPHTATHPAFALR
jgi:hypothetical protein